MGSFKLGKMTLRSVLKKPETVMYPLQERFAPEGRKGHVTNDMKVCILCGICQKRCPADAITVAKKDGAWSIDYFRCVQCGSCVRECPKHCLSMEKPLPKVSAQLGVTTLTVPEPTEEEKAAAAAKAAEKAAKIAAAKAAKAAAEGKAEEPAVKLSDEMEAKLAAMDPEKAAKVRAAREAKAKKEAAEKAQAGE